MHKHIVMAGIILGFPVIVFAQGNQAGQRNRITDPAVHTGTPTPQRLQIQNRNEETVQNQGEEYRLQESLEEQETTRTGSPAGQGESLENRNANARLHMSDVARQVQLLLQVRTEGGLGEQVRVIAREQNEAHVGILESLDRLESKGPLARLLTGTDYGAVSSLKAQLAQNRARLARLQQLETRLTDPADITMVAETIRALTEENAALESRILAEEKTKSIFGWALRLFAR